MQTGRPYDLELRLRRHDGVYRWFHSRVTPVPDEQGRILKWIGVATDIEEEKQTQDQLRSSQKLEAMGRLAGGVAHDFNNLLTAITGYNALAMKELREQPELLAYLQEVKGAADRAADLTRQLLAFSRRQVVQAKLVDVNKIVENISKLLTRVIGEDIELITNLAAETGIIKADPLQVDQVIMNLAVNARDAMPNGGRLAIETACAAISEDEAQALNVPAGEYVLLSVKDTGSGMDTETKSHLFEPFFTTKVLGKGTGLGLAIVYGIVAQSGGLIRVESEPGMGTTFRIYFPRCGETPEEDAAQSPAAGLAAPTGLTILLVEDEATVRKLVGTMLTRRGFSVLEAATPAEAIRIAGDSTKEIEVLLSDVLMPDMRGPELAEKIRELRPNIGVIFMSGYSDRTFMDPAVIQDAGYLQKPFTSEGLISKIRDALEAGRPRNPVQ
jgi:signal transduction histidine kinase/CheY-like chemotaxis protein